MLLCHVSGIVLNPRKAKLSKGDTFSSFGKHTLQLVQECIFKLKSLILIWQTFFYLWVNLSLCELHK